MTWTRAHDAWIAEKCEGWSDTPLCGWPHYSTDPAACIRAAEAWAAKDPKRRKWWIKRDGNIHATVDQGWMSDGAVMDTAAAALAQALYRATGGPA